MKRGSARLLWCVTCLLVTCLTGLASEPAPTSPEPWTAPLIGLPTVERLTQLLGSSDLYSGSEIADWLVNDLLPLEIEPAVRTWGQTVAQRAAEDAAAETARPLLEELAGVTAERDAFITSRNVWMGFCLVTGIVAVLGWITAVLT